MDMLNKNKDKALKLTTKPGVYLMKNLKEEIIYIGKAKNLKNRVISYFRNLNAHNLKVRKMVENVADFDFIITKTEFEALVLECSLIKEYKPKYNILLKDSKGYKYIKIPNTAFPKIEVCTKKQKDGAKYIGPFVNSFSVKQAVEEVNKIFMLPICKNDFSKPFQKKRPCLNFYIKKCMGVCQKKISSEEYLKILNQAIIYIKNGGTSYVEKIKKEMENLAKKQDFEKAIKLRDKLKAIEKITQTQKVYLNENLNADVIAYYCLRMVSSFEEEICFVILKIKAGKIYNKENFIFNITSSVDNIKEDFIARYYFKKEDIPKSVILDYELKNLELYEKYLKEQANHKVEIKIPKKGVLKELAKMAYENSKEILNLKNKDIFREDETLLELKKFLNLKKTPNYIEAYDVSNLGNFGIVGGMIVFKNGGFYKKNYRKFKIKTVKNKDDYACTREILQRRIERFKKQEDESFKVLPDLIFLDGGKSHLMVAKKIFEKENFKVSCFGLVKDEKHKTRAIVSEKGEISIKNDSKIFLMLSKIQEEVHRFTITYQKNLRKKENLKFKLNGLERIGEKTSIKILKHYENLEEIKKSTPEEISKIAKISLKKAEEILKFFE